MNLADPWVLWLVGQVVVGVAIWSGIKAEIKAMHKDIATAQAAADKANSRIDAVLERFPDTASGEWRQHRRGGNG